MFKIGDYVKVKATHRYFPNLIGTIVGFSPKEYHNVILQQDDWEHQGNYRAVCNLDEIELIRYK